MVFHPSDVQHVQGYRGDNRISGYVLIIVLLSPIHAKPAVFQRSENFARKQSFSAGFPGSFPHPDTTFAARFLGSARHNVVLNGIASKMMYPSQRPSSTIRFRYSLTIPSNFGWGFGGRLPGLAGGSQECTEDAEQAIASKTCWAVQLSWNSAGRANALLRLPTGGRATLANTRQASWRKWPQRNQVDVVIQLGSLAGNNGTLRVRVNNVTVAHYTNVSYNANGTWGQDSVLIQAYFMRQMPILPSSSNFLLFDKLTLQRSAITSLIESPAPQSPSAGARAPPPQEAPTSSPGSVPTSPPPSSRSDVADLTDDQLRRAMQLTTIFENADINLKYDYCENLNDGRGYTFGAVGFCTGTGDGVIVVEQYVNRKPSDNLLAAYLPVLRDLAARKSGSTANLSGFCKAVASAAEDPVFRSVQDDALRDLYYLPSTRWARQIGAKLALTKGQLYDAMVNHGEGLQDSFSIDHLIEKTSEALLGTPLTGVDEVTWLATFLDVREKVLMDAGGINYARRISFYRQLLTEGNLQLGGPIHIAPTKQPTGWTITNVYHGRFQIQRGDLGGKRSITIE